MSQSRGGVCDVYGAVVRLGPTIATQYATWNCTGKRQAETPDATRQSQQFRLMSQSRGGFDNK